LLAQDGTSARTNSGSAAAGAAAAGGGAADASYRGLLSALIKDAIVEPQGISGNPRAIFEVRVGQPSPIASADGRDCPVTSVSLKRTSGVRMWDEAAERGIRKSGPWPRRPNGDCPVGLHEISSGPRD
ncbi:MAG: IgA-specific serine endopeptidase autotransporter precursor, partial [Pseudomonadota bacterium]